MELRQLKYFLGVADTLNFSEAARRLFITQSTLSQQIKQLEEELGTPLFSRSSHSVALTEAGAELVGCARRTLAEADACQSRLADLAELRTGMLNIGVTYSFSPILTETLVEFMKMYPRIKLNIYYKPMEELMGLLRSRQVDFALAFKPLQPQEGIESHMLFQNRLAAIVRTGHSLAERTSVSLAELAGYDLALPSRGLQARNAFDHVAGARTDLRIRLELNEVNILLKLLRATNLVSVLAEATIHAESGVKAIPLALPDNEMTGCVHTLRDAYRKRSATEFIRMLADSMAVRDRRDAWL